MVKKIVVALILLIVALLIVKKIVTQDLPLTGTEKYFLNAKEIRSYSEQAKNGDGNAAYTLGMHYSWAEGDMLPSYYWFYKGIELGHSGCIYEFSSSLFYSNNETIELVALKYLNLLIKKAEEGNEEAILYKNKISSEYLIKAKAYDTFSDEQKQASLEYLEKILEEAREEVER